ncbi:MAG: adenylate/guanylate cyclase domain-containing protein [Hyphomicrobiales bacterium]|nr:adenylate/guanylate cyclase domain-containing protein [Hyphomicrobiales bacterium]
MDRKLAAILAADVVGYSAMMERDEAGTHERLSSGRRDLFEPTIARHHGTIFKLMGDGMLAEFSSVVEAVECAVALQRGLAERNAEVPADQRVQVRIGVNLGEVIVEGDDRFGEGVNIAARLEQLAEPGGIWVSAKVAREVEKKLAFGFESMGNQKVKNIVEPVEAYRVTLDGQAAPRRRASARQLYPLTAAILVIIGTAVGVWTWWQGHGSPSGELSERNPAGVPLIAVLPFKNMSGDPKLDYFSDGVTENLISLLAGVTAIQVISRSSTLIYTDKPTDVREIGRELNVSYVIEGSVWKEPERIRITAQLTDAKTGENLWAEKFDRNGTDPLALQDAVIDRIAGSLGGMRGKMYENEYRKVWEKDTPDLEEYDFFLRSNFFFQQFTPESLVKATDIILEGLRKFPDSSLLSCGLAWDHTLAATLGFDDQGAEHWRQASEIQNKILPRANLGPDARKSCLWSSVYVSAHEGKFDVALQKADELIALSPGDAFLHGDLSQAARWAGKTQLALDRAEYGINNDPNYRDYYISLKANVLTDLERYEESAVLMDGIADVQFSLPLLRAINYVNLGKLDAARGEIAKALAVFPGYKAERWRDMTFHVDRAVIDRQVADLIAAGLPEK